MKRPVRYDYTAVVDGNICNLTAYDLGHALWQLGNLDWAETETVVVHGREVDFKEGDPT